jgi:hypothetical protein
MTDEIIMEDNDNQLTGNSSEKIKIILNKIIDGYTLPVETPRVINFTIKDLIKDTNVLRGEADSILNRLSLNDVLNYEEETLDCGDSQTDEVYVVYFDINFLDKANKYLNKISGKDYKPEKLIDMIEKKPEIRIGKLVSYADGSIEYDGKALDLTSQQKVILRLFMENKSKLVLKDDILVQAINSDKRESIKSNTISKYVSAIRKVLKEKYKKDVLINTSKEGWTFSP